MKERKSILLTITETCNLSCVYCYEHHKTKKKMGFELAIEIINYELENSDEFKELEIIFHGGEPFIEFALIKKICEFYWEKKLSKKVIFYATTNGTLIHGAIKKWLADNKHRFTCGLSLDGNKQMQDVNRSNSFDDIDVPFFKNNWPNQGVKMTISELSLPYLFEGYKYLYENRIRVGDSFASMVSWSNENLHVLRRELDKMVDYYYNKPDDEIPNLINLPISRIMYKNEERGCDAGKSIVAYDTAGEVYPCHLFCEIVSDEYEAVRLDEFFELKGSTSCSIQKCNKCPIVNICPNCFGANYMSTGNMHNRNTDICNFILECSKASAKLWYLKLRDNGGDFYNLNSQLYTNIVNAIGKIMNLEVV